MRWRHEAVPHHVDGRGRRQRGRRLWLAIATQIVVFPWFGIETGLAEHLTIGLAFVGVSLARGYLLRRLFEAIRIRRAE